MSACVACGYYLSSSSRHGVDSATRLAADLAGDEGMAALARGDGVYAFAQWDKQREQLCVGVDKLGMRPLYWSALPGGGYAVASELKVLVSLQDRLEPDWCAWEEFLACGNVFGAHTFFHGIQRVGAAEAITFSHDGHTSRIVERFLESIEVRDRPVEEFVEEQGAAFDAAMARLASLHDKPGKTILTLSGGHDSRRILAGLLKRDIRPEVYTVPEVLADGSEYESDIVRELCHLTGLTGHHVYPATSVDRMSVRGLRDLAVDFESSGHNYSTILALALDCADCVNYDGLAGDIELSGLFMKPGYFQAGGDEAFVANWPHPPHGWMQLPGANCRPLHDRLRAEFDRWTGHPNRFAYFYLMGRTRRMVSLAPLSLQANVFESLYPYLDRDVMRSAFGFPPARFVGGYMQPRLIRALNSALGEARSADALNSRAHKVSGVERRRERHALVRQAGRLPVTSRAWSGSASQKRRFQMIGALPFLVSGRQAFWEFGRAATLVQLAHFERVSRSSTDYRDAVMDLQDAFGRHGDWCRPL
ncbi:MAG TPA: hypothetical protein VFW60_00350 [Rhodanobacteraceae bacterium]|nr:hypothetical protein [Rhodanobacteraceae bacterium]